MAAWRRRTVAAMLGLAALALIPEPPGGVVPPFARAKAGVGPLAAGVHAPNRPWREQDFQRIADAQVGAVKMLSYHSAADYARVQHDLPGVDFTLRLMTPWNELPAPELFVAEHAPKIRALVDAGYAPWVEIGNEPNLELHPLAEQAFGEWYGQVLDGLRKAVPEAKYGYPGLARDRREREWWGASAGVIARSDWLGVHAYWRDAREMLDPHRALELMALHRTFPELPMLVTEAGNDGFGATAAERADEYGRFVRTLDRLPYVRAVHYFILSGTPEWQRFFLDDAALDALRETRHEPVPVLDGLAQVGQGVAHGVVALLGPLLAPARPDASAVPGARAAPVSPPTPTAPPPFARRTVLADSAPAPGGTWMPVPGRAPALRTASTYLGTDFSVKLALQRPAHGEVAALQIADGDLVTPGSAATGFALVWDGEQWWLKYQRDGTVRVSVPLDDGAPPAPPVRGTSPRTGATFPQEDGEASTVRVELALERRSAAAWVWPAEREQPAEPNAVFAPLAEAERDGARPRALLVPAALAQSVVLEVGTRD